jgi:hypothetical protein
MRERPMHATHQEFLAVPTPSSPGRVPGWIWWTSRQLFTEPFVRLKVKRRMGYVSLGYTFTYCFTSLMSLFGLDGNMCGR